ncbi:hypothetical protein GCM10010269_28090 [Streptomyces humidus]|uniref:Uncharacterized protein n=1 Tax=Streptomyces humidus TaxID=52259 RepID=A0A918FV01_9ACTN|nr:hypothetical protein GCM10010269_28090 [Streptomyces humidus]
MKDLDGLGRAWTGLHSHDEPSRRRPSEPVDHPWFVDNSAARTRSSATRTPTGPAHPARLTPPAQSNFTTPSAHRPTPLRAVDRFRPAAVRHVPSPLHQPPAPKADPPRQPEPLTLGPLDAPTG